MRGAVYVRRVVVVACAPVEAQHLWFHSHHSDSVALFECRTNDFGRTQFTERVRARLRARKTAACVFSVYERLLQAASSTFAALPSFVASYPRPKFAFLNVWCPLPSRLFSKLAEASVCAEVLLSRFFF